MSRKANEAPSAINGNRSLGVVFALVLLPKSMAITDSIPMQQIRATFLRQSSMRYIAGCAIISSAQSALMTTALQHIRFGAGICIMHASSSSGFAQGRHLLLFTQLSCMSPFHASACLRFVSILNAMTTAAICEQIFRKIVQSLVKKMKTALRHVRCIMCNVHGPICQERINVS